MEKRLLDGERGTGWIFLVEYGSDSKQQGGGPAAQRTGCREILTGQEYALFDK